METPNFPLGLTFDDILLIPGFSGFQRSEIDLSTKLTRRIKLSLPFISSPMDTVTESKLAITLAKLGGIGIIHRNLSVCDQADEVSKVKTHSSGSDGSGHRLLVGAAIGSNTGFEERHKTLMKTNPNNILDDPVLESIQ